MGFKFMYFEQYAFESKESLSTWNEAKQDPYGYVEAHYDASAMTILIHMKKVFGITPVSIRTGKDEAIKRLRKIALYLIANHYKEPIETIQKMFLISIDELNSYRKNHHFKEEYRDALQAFYGPLIEDELSRLYNRLAIFEKIEKLSSEELEHLGNIFGLERP